MYFLSALALPVLQRRDNSAAPWWHLPAALLAILSTLWVASQAKFQSFQMLALILLVGTVLYLFATPGKTRRE